MKIDELLESIALRIYLETGESIGPIRQQMLRDYLELTQSSVELIRSNLIDGSPPPKCHLK